MKVYFITSILLILYFSEVAVQKSFGLSPPFNLDMSNLGSFISSQVQDHVKSITSKVNEDVSSINRNINREMSDLSQNLARKMNTISENVEVQMKGLSDKIHANVENSLKPVQAMMITSAMANGVGGTTVVIYGGSTTLFIINGNKYICPGNIISTPQGSVQCSVRLTPNTDENVCTESSYSRLNNIYCFGSYASLQCLDNSCQCKNGAMYTINAMRKLCGPAYGTDNYAQYTYYPDTSDPNHIEIPNSNEHVYCQDGNTGHCSWHGNGFIIPIKDI